MIHYDHWAVAAEHLDKVPDAADLARLDVGDCVKICNGEERFWVCILRSMVVRDGQRVIVGEVRNQLVIPRPYNCGDMVAFKEEHVYDIMFADERDQMKEVARQYFAAGGRQIVARAKGKNVQLSDAIKR